MATLQFVIGRFDGHFLLTSLAGRLGITATCFTVTWQHGRARQLPQACRSGYKRAWRESTPQARCITFLIVNISRWCGGDLHPADSYCGADCARERRLSGLTLVVIRHLRTFG